MACLASQFLPPQPFRMGESAPSANLWGARDLHDSNTAAHVLRRKSSLLYSDKFIWFNGLSYKHFGHDAAQKTAASHAYLRKAFHNFLSCFHTICSSVGWFEILLILKMLET